MIWFMVLQIVSTLVELIRLGRKSESEKDLEILLLRRQLAIFERKQSQPTRLSRGEKLALVVLGTKLKAKTGRTIHQMRDFIRIVKPATLFGWHKQLVRLKWTYRQRHQGGRPRTDREIEQLVLRSARRRSGRRRATCRPIRRCSSTLPGCAKWSISSRKSSAPSRTARWSGRVRSRKPNC
jgi:hypothetical protein